MSFDGFKFQKIDILPGSCKPSYIQEDGDFEKATLEKLRLEEKQRAACRIRKEHQIEWKRMWFKQVCVCNCHSSLLL